MNIPDPNFKAKLLAADISNTIAYRNGSTIKIDANADGVIQLVEVQSIDSLNVDQGFISDLTGIASFSNLKRLDCGNEFSLSNLNLSGLTALKTINCGGSGINTMNISGLINLQELSCGNNNMITLDLNGLTSLRKLYCSNNQLTSLNLSGLMSLQLVFCNNNQIQGLNLIGLPNLYQIVSSDNQISNLTLTNLPNFTNAYFDNNNLTSLTLDSLNSLNSFNASYNALTTVTVNNCPNIYGLALDTNLINSISFTGSTNIGSIYIQNNLLTNINLSSLSSLSYFNCYNNLLTNIDVSANHNFSSLICLENPNLEAVFMKFGRPNLTIQGAYALDLNPNLHYVCVDEFRAADFLNYFAANNRSDIVVNTYCSFTPGGNYNTIIGSIIFDADNNGCDVTDTPQPNIRVNMTQWGINSATFSNSNGNYTFYTTFADQSVTPQFENSTYFNVSPQDASISFANNNNNIATQNFCITANGIHPDVEVVIAPITPARPDFDAQYKIVYKNKGNQTLSGNVTFGYDDAVLDFVSSTVIPNSQSTGLLT